MSHRITFSSNPLKYSRFLIEYVGIFVAFHFVRLLPLRGLQLIARICATVGMVLPEIRRVTVANLHTVFPEMNESDINVLAKKCLANIVLALLEFVWFLDRPDRLDKYTSFSQESRDIAEKAIAAGRGVIYVTPHLGNWELAGLIQTHAMPHTPFAVVARKIRNPFLHRLINLGRGSEGTEVIPAKGAIKGMMKALKKGCFIATLIDQNTKGREGGIFVDFFGLPVPTSPAPALFGRRLNTEIVVAGCIREEGRYVSFTKPLPKPANEYESDEELIQDLMRITEGLVRTYPDQYLWFYRRFQFIPRDLAEDKRNSYPFYATEVTDRFYSNLAPKDAK